MLHDLKYFFFFYAYLKTCYWYKPIITKLSNDTFYYRSSTTDFENYINISTNKIWFNTFSTWSFDLSTADQDKKQKKSTIKVFNLFPHGVLDWIEKKNTKKID